MSCFFEKIEKNPPKTNLAHFCGLSPVPLTKQKEQTVWSALFVGAGEERKTVNNCFARTNSTKQGATRLECTERLVATMRLEWESSFKTAETGLPPVAALADKQSTGLFGAMLVEYAQIASAIFSLLQVPFPLQNKKSKPYGLLFLLVRETGLEPVHQRYTPLKRARLPIPPLPRGTLPIIHERISKVKGFCEKIFYFFQN